AGLPKFLESTRSVAVSLATIAALGIVVALAVREIRGDGISIDPVIVELNGLKEPMTPELASQRIAKYLDAIQNSGVKEWHRLNASPTEPAIELQIPGMPFNLYAATNQIAAMFGIKRTIIRASIISRSVSPRLVASVSLVGNAE